MSKNCSAGKPCGGSCVSRVKKCDVEFPQKVSNSFDQVVDKILSHPQYLDTPEKAVAWLESHKDQLIMGGIGDWGDKKGDLMILGIEPGENPGSRYYDESGKLHKRLSKIKEEDGSDLTDNDWGQWYDKHPLTFANDLRQTLQVANALKKQGSSDLPSGQAAAVAMGRTKVDPSGYQRESVEGRNKKSPFIRKMLRMADDSPWRSLRGSNISPVALPSDKYWPFSKLPFKADSPFVSRDSWMKYASGKMADKFKTDLKESPRKLVIVGANRKEHKEMFRRVAQEMGSKVSLETLNWKSEGGKAMKADVSYFAVDGPKGKTVFIQTNHPSWTGWTNEALDKVSGIAARARGES